MKKISKIFLGAFFKVGERSALILVLLTSLFLIYSETATQAHSQEQPISFERADVSWYGEKVGFEVISPSTDSLSYSLSVDKVTPTPTPKVQVSADNADIWERLADCESHKNWGANTGNGYYGGLQFNQGAWNSVGGSGLPSDAGRDEQIMRGKMLQEKRGWGPWGACSKKLGLL